MVKPSASDHEMDKVVFVEEPKETEIISNRDKHRIGCNQCMFFTVCVCSNGITVTANPSTILCCHLNGVGSGWH